MKRQDIVDTVNSLIGIEGHNKILEEYNSQKPLPRGYKVKATDAWCAATVSAVFLMNNYHDFSECSCPCMIEKAKKLNLWVEDDSYRPKPGDVIMYDWQDSGVGDDVGVADHVGIVIGINNDTMTIREGNFGGTIKNGTLKVDARYIRGYITPLFDESAEDKSKEDKSADKTEKTENEPYRVGAIYTIKVKTALNVRKGAGTNFEKVGYNNLTPDGKKHATMGGALLSGTKVTCLEIKNVGKQIWIRIPSGWICAKGKKVHLI